MRIERKIACFILDHRLPIAAAVLIATGVLGFQLRLFHFHQNEFQNIEGNRVETKYYNEFCKKFNDSELMVVAVRATNPPAPDIFTPSLLAYVKTLTDALGAVPNALDVVSLSTVRDLNTGDPFLEPLPTSPGELEQKKTEALANKYWVGSLVSADAEVTVIIVRLPALASSSGERFKTVRQAREILDAHRPPAGAKVYLTGSSALMLDSLSCMMSDFKRFLWLTPILVAVLLFAVFRTVRGIIIPLIVIVASVVWTLGILFSAGKGINVVTSILPSLIAVICFSDTIHILSCYYSAASRSADRASAAGAAAAAKREVLVETMEHMIYACFLTSLTTVVGFGSLAVSNIAAIREFGIFAAIGIIGAYVLSITIIPVILSVLPLPRAQVHKGSSQALVNSVLERLSGLVCKDKLLIPVAALLIAGVSIFGISRLRTGTHISANLPDSAPSKQAMRFLEEKMGGFGTLEITLEGKPGFFKQSWAVKQVEQVQLFLQTRLAVDSSFSVADLVKAANKADYDDDPKQYVVPDDDRDVASCLHRLSRTVFADQLYSFVTPGYATARISARVRSVDTEELLHLLDELELFAKTNVDPRLEFHTTGAAKLFSIEVAELTKSQIQSFGLAFAVICVLMILVFRSWRAGLVAMIPNALPVLLTLGLMGLVKIPLDLATVMIACIAIGIAVDDTIHFLVRYHRFQEGYVKKRDGSHTEGGPSLRVRAIHHTMLESGRAIIFTSFVIAGGFLIFVLSSFAANRHFGALLAFTMLSALAADLLVLPVLIRRFKL